MLLHQAARGNANHGAAAGAAAWAFTALFGLSLASVFPTVLTHAERSMRVSGRVASLFVVAAATGETLLPLLVALFYASSHASFLSILLAACVAQAAAWVGARRAALAIGRRPNDSLNAASRSEQELAASSVASMTTTSAQSTSTCEPSPT